MCVCCCGAQVGADQVQAQVNSRSHAGGREDVAVVDVELIWQDIDVWVALTQLLGVPPVCGRGAPVEQPGRSKSEGRGADGDESGASGVSCS